MLSQNSCGKFNRRKEEKHFNRTNCWDGETLRGTIRSREVRKKWREYQQFPTVLQYLRGATLLYKFPTQRDLVKKETNLVTVFQCYHPYARAELSNSRTPRVRGMRKELREQNTVRTAKYHSFTLYDLRFLKHLFSRPSWTETKNVLPLPSNSDDVTEEKASRARRAVSFWHWSPMKCSSSASPASSLLAQQAEGPWRSSKQK